MEGSRPAGDLTLNRRPLARLEIMENVEIQFGSGALVIVAIYLIVMLGLGWLGRLKRREETMKDFYLGGSSLGLFVLFLTLFATQYSGNTLIGNAGQSFRQGGTYIASITWMILAITTYMIYAPRLYRLSRRFGYITPADFLYHRFGSHGLRILAVALLCWGLGNYVLQQLVAMGHVMESISNGRINFMTGVLLLATVMIVYESLGGMRSVAWTDVIQGILLLSGCTCILYVLLTTEGGLPAAVQVIATEYPERIQSPGGREIRTWISRLLLLGLGVSIYPHAIQRIFAARSQRALSRSFAGMAFMPFVTTSLAFFIGYIALSKIPAASEIENDKITMYVLSTILHQSAFTYWLVVIVFAAVVAAVMSTADSALLSIQSMLTKDIYKVYIRPDADDRHLLKVGKIAGWVLMALLIGAAYYSRVTQTSLWELVELKMEFMVQLSPALILGVFWRRMPASSTFAGMAAGTVVTLVIWGGALTRLWPVDNPLGINSGVWGLIVNYAICIIGGWMAPAPITLGRANFVARVNK